MAAHGSTSPSRRTGADGSPVAKRKKRAAAFRGSGSGKTLPALGLQPCDLSQNADFQQMMVTLLQADPTGEQRLTAHMLAQLGERVGPFPLSLSALIELGLASITEKGQAATLVDAEIMAGGAPAPTFYEVAQHIFPQVAKADVHRQFATHITAEELENLKNEFDANSVDGLLTIKGLRRSNLMFCGMKLSVSSVKLCTDGAEAATLTQLLSAVYPRVPMPLLDCYARTKLTPSEVTELRQRFDELDLDGSGFLTLTEFRLLKPYRGVAFDDSLFHRIDQGSGQVGLTQVLRALFPLVPEWDLQYGATEWGKPGSAGGGQPSPSTRRDSLPASIDVGGTGAAASSIGSLSALRRMRKPPKTATQLTDEETSYLVSLYKELDTAGTGKIAMADIKGKRVAGVLVTGDVFRKIDRDSSGTIPIAELIGFCFPKLPSRDVQRLFVRDLTPDMVHMLRSAFQGMAVNGALDFQKAAASQGKILGMKLNIRGLKTKFVGRAIGLVDVVKSLFPLCPVGLLERYSASEIPLQDFLVVKQGFDVLDKDGNGTLSSQEFLSCMERGGGKATSKLVEWLLPPAPDGSRADPQHVLQRVDPKSCAGITLLDLLRAYYPCVPESKIRRFLKGGYRTSTATDQLPRTVYQETKRRTMIMQDAYQQWFVLLQKYEEQQRSTISVEEWKNRKVLQEEEDQCYQIDRMASLLSTTEGNTRWKLVTVWEAERQALTRDVWMVAIAAAVMAEEAAKRYALEERFVHGWVATRDMWETVKAEDAARMKLELDQQTQYYQLIAEENWLSSQWNVTWHKNNPLQLIFTRKPPRERLTCLQSLLEEQKIILQNGRYTSRSAQRYFDPPELVSCGTQSAPKETRTGATYHPDGHRVVTFDGSNLVYEWDTRTGTVARTFSGHEAPVHAAVYTPDGQRLLTGGEDCTVRVWDCETGDLVCRYTGHREPVVCVSIAPDGWRAVSCDIGGGVREWACATGATVQTLTVTRPADEGGTVQPASAGVVRLEYGKTGTIIHGYTPDGAVLKWASDPSRAPQRASPVGGFSRTPTPPSPRLAGQLKRLPRPPKAAPPTPGGPRRGSSPMVPSSTATLGPMPIIPTHRIVFEYCRHCSPNAQHARRAGDAERRLATSFPGLFSFEHRLIDPMNHHGRPSPCCRQLFVTLHPTGRRDTAPLVGPDDLALGLSELPIRLTDKLRVYPLPNVFASVVQYTLPPEVLQRQEPYTLGAVRVIIGTGDQLHRTSDADLHMGAGPATANWPLSEATYGVYVGDVRTESLSIAVWRCCGSVGMHLGDALVPLHALKAGEENSLNVRLGHRVYGSSWVQILVRPTLLPPITMPRPPVTPPSADHNGRRRVYGRPSLVGRALADGPLTDVL